MVVSMEQIRKLESMIHECHHIVFFGGAGVSTESGIPDFRSKDGLYHMNYKFPPETILSHSFFFNNTDYFFKFYREKMNSLKAKPNICHEFLTKLEKSGKLEAIITQNIDGLHQKAGSKKVLELHGSIYHNYCMKCHQEYSAEYVFYERGIPICKCGGIIKPSVILYEEPLDSNVIEKSISAIEKADLLIIAGTSLTVYPANSFIHYFHGKYLVVINKEKIQYNIKPDLMIQKKLGDVFSKIKL